MTILNRIRHEEEKERTQTEKMKEYRLMKNREAQVTKGKQLDRCYQGRYETIVQVQMRKQLVMGKDGENRHGQLTLLAWDIGGDKKKN